jgi:hypothetical protein
MEKMIVAMAKSDNETGIVMRAKKNLFSDQIQSFSGMFQKANGLFSTVTCN